MAESLRVLFVADLPPDPNAGASGTEFQTAQALRVIGHEVDEVWQEQLPHRIRHGNLHYLLEQPGAYWHVINERAHKLHYDVIHLNQSAAWLAARNWHRQHMTGVVVSRSHGFEQRAGEVLKLWSARLKKPLRGFPSSIPGRLIDAGIARSCRLNARYADGHIVSCSEDRDFLIKRFHVAGDRIACIAQAAPDSYRSAVRPTSAERMRRLLMVGPVKLWKGIHALAEAWNRLAPANPELTLTWVCSSNEWPDASAMLVSEAKERTRFVENSSQETLMDIYDSHGIFLFPSLFEGFGKAPLEAMARGLCVIASDTGGMHDVITSGHDGILVEPGDTGQLRDAILKLQETGGMFPDMSYQARSTAMRYSWHRTAVETAAFYERLIRPAPSVPG
jgi:glycosyltransferase involved in cell wall biosynthesis